VSSCRLRTKADGLLTGLPLSPLRTHSRPPARCRLGLARAEAMAIPSNPQSTTNCSIHRSVSIAGSSASSSALARPSAYTSRAQDGFR